VTKETLTHHCFQRIQVNSSDLQLIYNEKAPHPGFGLEKVALLFLCTDTPHVE